MARSTKVTEKINRAQFESNQGNLTPEELAQLNEFPGTGYYTRTTLEDVINNFIISHVGMDKVLSNVPRHEIAYWAQRGLQEFNYDILLSEKNIEFEISESLSWPLPADYVNYVKIVYVDGNGNERVLMPRRTSTAKQGLLQDNAYGQIYDSEGRQVVSGRSLTTERFQGEIQDYNAPAREALFSKDLDDIYDYYYSGYFGRRYGLDPEHSNTNGTFQMDLSAGIIYFDSTFRAGDIMGLRYVSDGLSNNDDLAKVYVPKLAEDALYAFILYNASKVRPAAANLAPMYKKEMSAKMRNAKIRLSNYKLEEFAQVLRGRAKWIKH